jgi:enoyl-CoA hydratase/carnithine racemase
MAGQEIDAEMALMIGFVHAVYPRNQFDARVQAFARDLLELPGEVVGLAKLAIDAAASVDRATARDIERIANTQLLLSAQHRERIQEFQDRSSRNGAQSS